MRAHIIDELRPELPDIDPAWDAETMRAILEDRRHVVALVSERRRRTSTRLVLVVAAAAAIVGGAIAARDLLPAADVRPAGPARETITADVRFVESRAALKKMDDAFPTADTDRTYDAIGTKDFPLGEAPEDAYIFYKLGFECVDGAKYLFILNGDRNAASAQCDADDHFSSMAHESTGRVTAGTANVLTIEASRDVRYTVTVGYHRESINKGRGPRGTLPDGRTYGPLGDKERGISDLMPAHGDAGVMGYVDRNQLEGSMPAKPAEAVAQQKLKEQRYRDGERVDRKVPVLDTRGRQVDVFSIMLPVPR